MYYPDSIRGQIKRINYLLCFLSFCLIQAVILAADEDCLQHYSNVQLNGPGKKESPHDRLRELKTWMFLFAYQKERRTSNSFYAVRPFEKKGKAYLLKKNLTLYDMVMTSAVPDFFHFKDHNPSEYNQFKDELQNFRHTLNSLRSTKSTFEFFICEIKIENNKKYVIKLKNQELIGKYYNYNCGHFDDRAPGFFATYTEFWSKDTRNIFEEEEYSELEKKNNIAYEEKEKYIFELRKGSTEKKIEDLPQEQEQRPKRCQYLFYFVLLAGAYKLGTMGFHTAVKEFLQKKIHPTPSL